MDQVPLAGKLQYLEDPSRKLTLGDFTNDAVNYRFNPSPAHQSLNFGYSASAYWLRLPIHAGQGAAREWLLEFAYPSLDSVEVFAPDGKGGYLLRLQRPPAVQCPALSAPEPGVPGDPAAGEELTLYVRITSAGNLTMPAPCGRPKPCTRTTCRPIRSPAPYYGALAALAIYNLLLFFLIRDRRHAEYAAFAGCMISPRPRSTASATSFSGRNPRSE